jgi:hypothetical protein
MLTTFLTATNNLTIEVMIWKHMIEGNWTNVPSYGYRTLYYSVANPENDVMFTSLVVQRVKESDVTQHRAVIVIDDKQQTSDMIPVTLSPTDIFKLFSLTVIKAFSFSNKKEYETLMQSY